MFEPISEAEDLAYAESVRNMDFDKYLGAYPKEHHQQWIGLSGHITREVIEKLDSLNRCVLSEGRERAMRVGEEQGESAADERDHVQETIEALEKEM